MQHGDTKPRRTHGAAARDRMLTTNEPAKMQATAIQRLAFLTGSIVVSAPLCGAVALGVFSVSSPCHRVSVCCI